MQKQMKHILVTGAAGQIGTELVPALRERYGASNVIAMGHHSAPAGELEPRYGPFEAGDVNDRKRMTEIIDKYGIDTVFHLAGILSAGSEKNPDLAWKVNLESMKLVLDLAKDYNFTRVFWPSSIAAFGPTTPRENTPQHTTLEPTTMYGVAKVAGELLISYYHKKYGIDARSIRYPGLNGWKTPPSDGTTEYAVAIFYEALKHKRYECFLSEDTMLPMMEMGDGVRGTIQLMEADLSKVNYRISYNLAAMSFTPKQIAAEIKKRIPDFEITYNPDFHQAIADSWPKSIDDSQARMDWGWKPKYDLSGMTDLILGNLGPKLAKG